VWGHEKTVEKLKYMHRNPMRRGLVSEPLNWPWSSFRHYVTGGSARSRLNRIGRLGDENTRRDL